MEKFYSILWRSAMLLLMTASCKKETKRNTAPVADAGSDIMISILSTSIVLSGSAWDNDYNIKSHEWAKISGPVSYSIEKPASLKTKVQNLVKGVYQFELTVTDKEGLTSKDTTAVFVNELGVSKKIFQNLSWSCPWDCYVEIKNIYTHLPVNGVFKIYMKRDNSTAWHEAFPISQSNGSKYAYDFYNGTLVIYGIDYSGGDMFDDTPDIEIVF